MSDKVLAAAINELSQRTNILEELPWISNIPAWTSELANIMNQVAASARLSNAVQSFSNKIYTREEENYKQIPKGKSVGSLKYEYLKDLSDNNFFGNQVQQASDDIKDLQTLRQAYKLFNNIGIAIRQTNSIQYKIITGIDNKNGQVNEYTMDEDTFINVATRMSVSKTGIPTLVLSGKTAISTAIVELEQQRKQQQSTINDSNLTENIGDEVLYEKILSTWDLDTRLKFKAFEKYIRTKKSKEFWPNTKKVDYANMGNLIEAFLSWKENGKTGHLTDYLREAIKNNLPFWRGPDISADNGNLYQVKSEGASVMRWSTVMNLLNLLYSYLFPFLNINKDTGQLESKLKEGFSSAKLEEYLKSESIKELQKEFGS